MLRVQEYFYLNFQRYLYKWFTAGTVRAAIHVLRCSRYTYRTEAAQKYYVYYEKGPKTVDMYEATFINLLFKRIINEFIYIIRYYNTYTYI